MNKHTEQLTKYPPHILESRVEALKAELERKRGSLPMKLLAFVAVLLSLISLGLSSGHNSLVFALAALVFIGFAVVVGVGAWGLRSNLRDSTVALEKVTR
ncbi:hypothetical protein NPS53_08860 [Pseudomonas putida]|uniref:hypothetical protein n=1 Tax=Pseudomonas putida TaxID=303 RepID=UPI002364311D|nr:hypothetical protein [Pseudomonas putida]MDD2139684.1 hypothetical protein [Pseudomonas putida]HDS1721608.1 hypothetical protein [Pseudomonas putida]